MKALLAPLISFDVKTPVQAYTDTLPKALKDAILGHKVLVGMNTDMVLYAKGQPLTKSREMDGQMPFEEWIYGAPPDPIYFVRINGNRVIRLEVAKEGQPVQIYSKDVVSAMLRTDGSPVMTADSHTRTIREGDVETDPDKQAPAAPPSLRNPGESLPDDSQTIGVMRPVQFPKPHPDAQPGANPDEQQQPATVLLNPQATPPDNAQPAPTIPSRRPQWHPADMLPPSPRRPQVQIPTNSPAHPPASCAFRAAESQTVRLSGQFWPRTQLNLASTLFRRERKCAQATASRMADQLTAPLKPSAAADVRRDTPRRRNTESMAKIAKTGDRKKMMDTTKSTDCPKCSKPTRIVKRVKDRERGIPGGVYISCSVCDFYEKL